MKAKKFVGIFTLAIAVLLFAIIFLSTFYEISAFQAYVDSLDGNGLEGLGILVIILIMVYYVPVTLVLAILALIAGLKSMKANAGKGMVILGIVTKFLGVALTVFLAFIFIDMYPSHGWVSKSVYIFTGLLCLGTAIFDLCVVRFFKKVKPETEVFEAEAVQEIAPTAEE